jgi:hypothetical protein
LTDYKIYVEGGGHKDLDAKLREGFRKLIDRCGVTNRPRIVAAGGRQQAFESFKNEHVNGKTRHVAMLIDSEDPVEDVESPWAHLAKRPDDEWEKPAGATDDQVLFMTTCMETWLIADHAALQRVYAKDNPSHLKTKGLPVVNGDLESRDRKIVFADLQKATGACKKQYEKDERSFETLGELNPATLSPLPSFARTIRIIKEKVLS